MIEQLVDRCTLAIESEISAVLPITEESLPEAERLAIEVMRQMLQAALKAQQSDPIEFRAELDLPPSLNQMLRGTAMQRSRGKKQWTALAAADFKRQGCPVFSGPIWAQCEFHIQNMARDADNLDACRKPILDGLVKAKFIKDDNLRILRHERSEFVQSDRDYVVVTLRNWSIA